MSLCVSGWACVPTGKISLSGTTEKMIAICQSITLLFWIPTKWNRTQTSFCSSASTWITESGLLYIAVDTSGISFIVSWCWLYTTTASRSLKTLNNCSVSVVSDCVTYTLRWASREWRRGLAATPAGAHGVAGTGRRAHPAAWGSFRCLGLFPVARGSFPPPGTRPRRRLRAEACERPGRWRGPGSESGCDSGSSLRCSRGPKAVDSSPSAGPAREAGGVLLALHLQDAAGALRRGVAEGTSRDAPLSSLPERSRRRRPEGLPAARAAAGPRAAAAARPDTEPPPGGPIRAHRVSRAPLTCAAAPPAPTWLHGARPAPWATRRRRCSRTRRTPPGCPAPPAPWRGQHVVARRLRSQSRPRSSGSRALLPPARSGNNAAPPGDRRGPPGSSRSHLHTGGDTAPPARSTASPGPAFPRFHSARDPAGRTRPRRCLPAGWGCERPGAGRGVALALAGQRAGACLHGTGGWCCRPGFAQGARRGRPAA